MQILSAVYQNQSFILNVKYFDCREYIVHLLEYLLFWSVRSSFVTNSKLSSDQLSVMSCVSALCIRQCSICQAMIILHSIALLNLFICFFNAEVITSYTEQPPSAVIKTIITNTELFLLAVSNTFRLHSA